MGSMTQDEYDIIAMSLWKLKLDDVNREANRYRFHLLAGACLRNAIGPGGDPIALSDFCKSWQTALTLPVIGPVSLLKGFTEKGLAALINALGTKALPLGPDLVLFRARLGPVQRTVGLSRSVPFDVTQSINWGIKIIAAMGGLLRKRRMQMTEVAVVSGLVSRYDLQQVGSIVSAARTPEDLLAAIAASKESYMTMWAEALRMCAKMADIRIDETPRWGARRGR